MPRIKLTAGRIRDFVCQGADQGFLWDADAPGLAIRATAAGAKSYIFQGKLAGKSLRMTIGDVQTWLLDNADSARPGARQEARRLQTLIDQGLDPRNHKAEAIAAEAAKRVALRRRDVTVAEAWADYIAARSPDWGERHRANHTALASPGGIPRTRGRRPGEPAVTQPGPLQALMPLRFSDLDTDSVRNWLAREIARGPTQAHQAYRALRAFMAWAADQKGLANAVQADACTRDAVRRIVPKPKAKSDCLQREQLPGWFAAVDQVENPVIAAYLQVLLLTGARREELATLQWNEVDFRWQAMTIRDKVEGQRTIPMTPHVAALLRELKRINDTPPKVEKLRQLEDDGTPWEPSPWVFWSASSASGHLVDPSAAHGRACTAAGINDLTLHGLRRSFRTLSEWVEVPVGIVAQIMGHKPSATAEKHYTVRPLDLLRKWHNCIEAWILQEAGVKVEQPAADGVTAAA